MMTPSHIFCLAILSSFFSFSQAAPAFAQEDERKPLVIQPPNKNGGCLAVAEPMKLTGGWNTVYRAADDFVFTENKKIREVVWWGCSYDGRHGEDDGLDQVIGFAISIYEDNPDTNSPGRCIHRTIVLLNETNPRQTKFKNFGGSDVMRFNARLGTPFPAKKNERYWLSVNAYLSGEPMWVWFAGTKGNSKNAIDHGVNGTWGDQPAGWSQLDLAFELHSKVERLKVAGQSDAKPEKKEDLQNKNQQKPNDGMIEKLIARLGHSEYSEREAADKKLTSIGQEAARLLKPHIKHDNPEIRYRVRRILRSCGELEKVVSMKIHTLGEGEKFGDVSKLYNLSSKTIIEVNALGKEKPFAGMMLLIPPLN